MVKMKKLAQPFSPTVESCFFLNAYPEPITWRSCFNEPEASEDVRTPLIKHQTTTSTTQSTWIYQVPTFGCTVRNKNRIFFGLRWLCLFSSCSGFQLLVFSQPAKTQFWSTWHVLICWSASTVITSYWCCQTDQIAEGVSQSSPFGDVLHLFNNDP